ncbi:hypothetical protein HJC23_011513 [Cyclotella cryptica]|uniref:FHA domain-containing protein n=1 Tax=Cyclotella cryptica TaxID=29204 RepID=A0ABD3NS99_9STRA|eukprot:CCRYP_020178-RA/>CCRYP_020178-RA protein AED:0.16 eAED:0.17 QI:0/0/0/1/1/1/2/0/310
MEDDRAKRRWGDRPAAHSNEDDDELALAALLNDANARSEQLAREQNKPSKPQRPHASGSGRGNNHYQRPRDERGANGKPIVEDDYGERDAKRGRRRRWNDREEDEGGHERWGGPGGDSREVKPEEVVENPDKVKPEFGLSGALATDKNTGNTRNGVTLKFSEPPEARIPNTRWRLYVFRRKSAPDAASSKTTESNDDLIDTYHISKQSAYLFGRDRIVADIPVDHPSLSKQHAVLQYRALPSTKQQIGAPEKLQCKPYLMDLESTNGTFINGVRLDSARYYELRRGDVITLGGSTREYVLLTEQSAKTGI